jgi:phosphopantetheinyl transferase
MEQYLETMGRFLDIQREVTMTFMAGAKLTAEGAMRVGGGETEGPFLNDGLPWPESHAPHGPFHIIVSYSSLREEVIATCQLDLEEQLFLRHHTIGGRPSALDDTVTALPIVPLSVSLEVMAQVASLLVPNRQLIALRNVRAHQWILMEEQCRTLLVTAKGKTHEAAGEVEVRILENNSAESAGSEDRLILEGVLLFGDEYPEPPRVDEIPLRSPRPYPFAPEQYYREVMFHGPTFQSVVAIDQCGENGLDATVRVPPGMRLFRSSPSPRLHTDPVLLDAAGQVVGFWTVDRLQTRSVVFPIGFESLSIYGPWPCESESVKCHARPTALTDGWIRSNIDLVAPGGRLLVRLVAWEDMRIDLPRQFCRFVLSPRDVVLSSSWRPAISSFPDSSRSRCCRLDGLPAAIFEKGALPRAWIRMILSRGEQEVWLSLKVPEKRRKEWLVGRLAAKDAVRLFLKEHYQIELCPADIEIVTDQHGRPTTVAEPIDKLGCRLCLSIAHSGESAVAVVVECCNRASVGIDIELMGQSHDGLDKAALAEEEQALLASVPAASREEWLLRLWCAKESTAKALGLGMMGGPLNLVVQEVETESGKVGVRLTGELARQLPKYDGMLLTACSGRENELIFASSFVKSITRS